MNDFLFARFGREFRKYAAAASLTAIGNGMHFIAMAWFLYQATDTVASVALILIVQTLPGLLFSPWIGVLIDRWSDKWICVTTDVVRGLLLSVLVLAIHLDTWVVPVIYISAFLMAVCNAFFQPAVGALIRDISTRESLLNANIASNVCMQIGMLAGSSLGGILVAKFGFLTVIVLNIGSFYVSGALTAWIRLGEGGGTKAQARAQVRFLEQFRATYTYVRENHYLLWLAVVQMFGTATLSMCNTLLPAFVDRELRADAIAFGIIDATWGAGAIVGGLVLAFVARKVSRRHIMLYGPCCLALALLVFLTSQSVLQASLGYFLLAFVICIVRVSTDTDLVTNVDRDYFGKIKSTITMFISYITLGLYGVLGYLGENLSIRFILLGLAAVIFCGFLLRLAREMLGGARRAA